MQDRPRGKLHVFLGYAAGVGKTYQMLAEAQRLKTEGVDVVIGYFEPHGRAETIAQTEGLEFVPRRQEQHRGATFEEMDTSKVIARHPKVAVVDEFAHTNIPGSERTKRWEDVEVLRDGGIDVLTSVNVQHVESLNDQVWQVTGIRMRETIPDWVLQSATEVVMVDVTPRALVHRLQRGVVYSPEKARAALENFFTESNLTALREMALRQVAFQLEERMGEERTSPNAAVETIVLWLTPQASTAGVIRRAHRVSSHLGAICRAVYIAEDLPAIATWLDICRNLRIEATGVEAGGRRAEQVALFARQARATQIFVTRDSEGIAELIRESRDMQVTVVAQRSPGKLRQ